MANVKFPVGKKQINQSVGLTVHLEENKGTQSQTIPHRLVMQIYKNSNDYKYEGKTQEHISTI